MKRYDSLVVVVVYPGSEKFFSDFDHAIRTQDTANFDLLILVEDTVDLNGLGCANHSILLRSPTPASMTRNRCALLSYAKGHEYKKLIFCDIDDTFSAGRISRSISALEEADFVFNELSLVDCHGRILADNVLATIFKENIIADVDQILDQNFLGMTHTSVKVEQIPWQGEIPNVIAFDWYLFSSLLLMNRVGARLRAETTFYRQTESNFVGLKKPITKQGIDLAVRVKTLHYTAMQKFCEGKKNCYGEVYEKKKIEMHELSHKLRDTRFAERYISVAKQRINVFQQGWWSEAVPLSTWESYESQIL